MKPRLWWGSFGWTWTPEPNPNGKTKPGEPVFFSFIVYKSRARRNAVNKKVMADPRMAQAFDMKRMAFGGFKAVC